MLRLAIRFREMLAPRLGLILLPPLFWLLWMVATFPGLNSPEALDYAQVARHVARGDGFVTSAITPLGLALVPRLENHPSLSHAPVWVLWEALFFKASGARQSLAGLASGASWILAFWLLYALAARLFDCKVAFFAGAFFLVNLACLRFSVSGLPHLLTGTLLLALLFVLVGRRGQEEGEEESPGRMPWARLLLSAVLAALIVLCDYSLVWAATLPLLLFWMRWPRRAGLSRAGGSRVPLPLIAGFCFVGMVLLTASPWLARNYRVARDPLLVLDRYDLLTQTREYPGLTVYRRFVPRLPQPWEFANRHPVQVLRKGLNGVGTLSQQAGSIASFVILALFVLACLRPPAGSAGRVQRYFLLMLLIQAAWLSTSQSFDRLLAFVPGMTVWAAGAAHRLVGVLGSSAEELTGAPWWMRRKAAPLWLVWCVALLPLLGDRANARRENALTPTPNVEYLAGKTPRESAVMTDVPWLVAWYGDRTAVWLAQDAEELAQLEREAGRLSWLYFSRYRAALGSDIAEWWMAALQSPLGYKTFVPHPTRASGEVVFKGFGPQSRRSASAAGSISHKRVELRQ